MERTKEGRVIVKGKNGQIHTEITKTFGFTDPNGDFWVNIPTLGEKGQKLSDEDAIGRTKAAKFKDPVTGRTLIRHASLDSALKEAKERTNSLGQKRAKGTL